jgi:acyl-CoA synthetase (AMP-forming)/AMP-acid ligase II/thioesterase domain-containing protein
MTVPTEHQTLDDLLAARAGRAPDSVAIAARGRPPLSSAGLYRQVRTLAATLRDIGIRQGDRVALLMPTGPEMAAAWLGVAAHAASAPLNPSYRQSELEFYLTDLNVAALVIDSGVDSPARDIARQRGISIIELSPRVDAEAGVFGIQPVRAAASPTSAATSGQDPALAGDVALVLHTSGTTSRPKIVPLTHENLLVSSLNIARAFGLSDADRCLDVNPLFHIHGLMVMVASLLSGGSVAFLPPLDVAKFFSSLAELRPTWYSAVPTVHHSILSSAGEHRAICETSSLRFIRSCSAALSPRVLAQLESVFHVPVVEAYGMTEAAHQIAANPLPPGARKPGSVGLPTGSRAAIIDPAGRHLLPGQVGEIAIRGANVMKGYENNPPANAGSFVDGWLRTGDQGFLDEDGYIFINGRIKELINRGGEKISPREIDEVLADHPSVARAVAFPVPHEILGEEVAAAVVLRDGASDSASAIRTFAATRLADFKMPRQLVIVPSIPTGPTGKYQRGTLAKQLGLINENTRTNTASNTRDLVGAGDPLEYKLVEIWERLFAVSPIGVTDNFFDLGGHSILAARMLDEVEQACGWTVPPSTLHTAPTIAQLACELLARRSGAEQGPSLVKIQHAGERLPFVLLHGDYNGGGFYVRNLARRFPSDQPIYTFAPHGSGGEPVPPTIEAMAEDYVRRLSAHVPDGPYLLGGFSTAGLVAFEMARQLTDSHKTVALLVVIDMPVEDTRWRVARAFVDTLGRTRGLDPLQRHESYRLLKYRVSRLSQLVKSNPRQQLSYLLAKLGMKPHAPSLPLPWEAASQAAQSLGRRQTHLFELYSLISQSYIPRRYSGRIVLMSSENQSGNQTPDPTMGWKRVAREVRVVSVPGDHLGCITTHVNSLADELRRCVDDVHTWRARRPTEKLRRLKSRRLRDPKPSSSRPGGPSSLQL